MRSLPFRFLGARAGGVLADGQRDDAVRGGSEHLDEQQAAAAAWGLESGGRGGPLLILAGPGTGKTRTLVRRAVGLVAAGVPHHRILLLTFTRRAAQEMTRRARALLGAADSHAFLPWAGTFHAVAARLLRIYATAIGLDPNFTILDRSDAADLLDLLRSELGLDAAGSRFPRKGTCLGIFSRARQRGGDLAAVLNEDFPWCVGWEPELRRLWAAYSGARQSRNLLDYDDLLAGWLRMMETPAVAEAVRGRFDHVLVDEYQDTNDIQAQILRLLCPGGSGLTVVGDPAQSIYAFRGATVRNILDLERHFAPPVVFALERSYRCPQPVLDACNALLEDRPEAAGRVLRAARGGGRMPLLVTAEDEAAEAEYVARRVLQWRERGVELQRQAVLFRAAHHSDLLEIELTRRGIPFVKYGGLRFLEAAHVKDFVAVLRWAANPRDTVSGFRVLRLLPGVGSASARGLLEALESEAWQFSALARAAANEEVVALAGLLERLAAGDVPWPAQPGLVRSWYEPHLYRCHESPEVRARDLIELERLAVRASGREEFLADLALEPPASAGDLAGEPRRDEEYLVLSTIHSAKGREWDVVYVIHVADGCLPSDLATGSEESVGEERRLLYVAMSRARRHLELVWPRAFHVREQSRFGDRHVLAPRSRFLEERVARHFRELAFTGGAPIGEEFG